MKNKRAALLLALLLGVQVFPGYAFAESAPAAQSDSADVVAESDLDAYENNEVLAFYQDGSYQIYAFDSREELADGLDTLAADKTVTLVQPNYSYEGQAVSTSDALAGKQWALSNDGTFQAQGQTGGYPVLNAPDTRRSGRWNHFTQGSTSTGGQRTAVAGIDVNAQAAWSLYNGKREVVVAIIDTGIDTTHEDLSSAIWVNADEIPDNGIDDDGNGYIDDVNGWNFYSGNNQVYTGSEDSHGTHGAGTIAASANNGVGIAGLVPGDQVKIMPVKALGGTEGSGTTASLVQAIRYAEANGAVICNLSLGSTENDRALYQAMASSNMLFVVAASNDASNTDATPVYPAAYDLDNILSVANLSYDGRLHSTSNYGATSVDLAAPGTSILSTTPGNGYSYMTGTSMAAPMVTAAAAMVYSQFDQITIADVKDILLSSVKKLDTLRGLVGTGGMLDIGAALAVDSSTLSGRSWTAPAVSTAGSAPEIAAKLITRDGTTYLMVQVTDGDGDLAVTAYASGEQNAAAFAGGKAGTAFSLNAEGAAVFSVQDSGVYTFYAVDAAGNETVKTIRLTL